MFGSLARLGLIVPSNNTTVEPEMQALAPAGVANFATRVMVRETNDPEEKAGTILAMHGRLDEAAEEVASLHPAAIAYACTSGSFLDGDRSDRAVCQRLASLTGIPTVTASTAVVAALRSLQVRRVALATPYIPQVSAGAKRYLQGAGFEVVAHEDLNLLSNLEKGRLDPSASADLVRSMALDGAEAVFISCTNWRTTEAVNALEHELGVPVVSSNLATYWSLLRLAEVGDGSELLRSSRLGTVNTAELPAFVMP